MKRLLLAAVLLCAGAQAAEAVCPSGAIDLLKTQDMQPVVTAAATGATFCLEAGNHQQQAVVPKNNQKFYGAAGAQMLGGKKQNTWVAEGALWYAPNQTATPPTTSINECLPAFPLCNEALAVWFNNEPLLQVSTKGAVTAGTFWRDAANSRIYIGANPASQNIFISAVESAFSGSATGVHIEGITMQFYAPRLQRAVIHGADGSGWTIDGVTVARNYAVGIDIGPNSTVRNSVIRWNGEMGMAGNGTGLLIEDNAIRDNGYWAGLDPAWEGGGFKLTEVYGAITTVGGQPFGTGATIRRNVISGNRAVGAWFDEGIQSGADNSGIVLIDNEISNNDSAGVSFEISNGAILIAGNTLVGNGVTAGWFWGGCVQIYDSKNAEIRDNTCDVSASHGNGMMVISQGGRNNNAGSGCGNNFHHNTIILRGSEGVSGATGDNLASWCNGNPNVFNNNTYFVATQADLTRQHWAWQDDEHTWAQFQALGQEANGTVTVGVP